MPRRINAKINVKLIDKKKLFEGQKGTYLDITLVETPGGKYGDWMVVQDQTKEERANNVKAPILGNGKNHGWGDSGSSAPPPSRSSSVDDIGF